jgi:tetratricopeptide (TPR) repeat protein
MKPNIPKQFLIALCLMLAGIGCIHAEDDEKALQESTYKVLSKAQEEMNQGDNRAALVRLQKLLPDISDLNYDTAVVLQTMGYVYHALDDIDNALSAFIKSVESGALPADVNHDLHFTIAQLAVYKGDYSGGLEYLKKWFADEPLPGADAHLLAANIYLQSDDYTSAIPHLKDAIKKSEKPSRNWYEMLLFAYIQTDRLKSAAALLETMIVRYPSEKNFWLHLVSVYQQSGEERKALAVSELAHSKGLLNADEILTLARNYLYHQMPYKAGKLLSEELDSGTLEEIPETLKLLANSWLAAQEYDRAIETLNTLSMKEPDEPVHAFRMARLLVEQQQWKRAMEALKHVVNAGNFEQMGEAWLMMGMCQYELNEKKASLVSFNKALGHQQSREQARWWLQQINEELEDTDV